ncbi:MAG: alpha/beta hydrolase [Anaerolineales bacterium]|nr:alpha/beta hydrolase [Anaerolineae bacterium]PWB56263.1 MAG: alpha/beta hydrolase [Anaerolineales bacterium]
MTIKDEAWIPFPRADVSHIIRKWLDVAYANISPSQMLDIYLPDDGEGPFPVILFIHGGGFALGDKTDYPVSTFLKGLHRGFAVVSVNYRLSGEAIFPAGLQDIKSAIRWLRANSTVYHLDGNRIAACGGSSGGNYAAMVCLTANVPTFDDLSLGNPEFPCSVQAAVDWFGPTDFLKIDEQLSESGFGPANHGEADSPESMYLGARLSDVPLKVELANPMTFIHKHMPPLLIQHGRLDTLVPVQQSIIFAEKLAKYVSHDRYEFDILEGAGHGDPLFDSDENMRRVFSFLDRYLK